MRRSEYIETSEGELFGLEWRQWVGVESSSRSLRESLRQVGGDSLALALIYEQNDADCLKEVDGWAQLAPCSF